jgi:pyruvate dehydrogenase complex dehydrogenase (E1) component
VSVPPVAQYGGFALQADGKEMSTTMAFVRMLGNLLKDSELGPRVVQRYAPEDIGSLSSTLPARKSLISLETGSNSQTTKRV